MPDELSTLTDPAAPDVPAAPPAGAEDPARSAVALEAPAGAPASPAADPLGVAVAAASPVADPAPTATGSRPGGPVRRRAALSPSRAKDFMQCPLLFRFRTIDRLPEPPSQAAVKGSLVHAVLERLFDLPARERTEPSAQGLLAPQWARLREERPEVLGMFTGPEDLEGWLAQARSLLSQYFRMENPQRLEPRERELLVETELASGVLLRGYVDRVDVAPNGAVRVVDYKTGKSPGFRFQDEALFQMRFYGLMLWRLHGTVPARLQLVYLGDGRILTHDPDPDELLALERDLDALWSTIASAARSGDFAPRRTRLCDWCSFQSLCPVFGGEPPEMPQEGVDQLLSAQALN